MTPPPTGGEGAADFGPGGHRASEGDGGRGVSERGGGGERHLQPVQQPAGNRVVLCAVQLKLQCEATQVCFNVRRRFCILSEQNVDQK